MGNSIITVNFHGSQLVGLEDDQGTIHVALKPIAEGMGLDWSAQYRRATRDPILSEGIAIMAMPLGHEQVFLRLDLLNGWLFGISAGSIKEVERREKVLTYQRECYRVLAAAFAGKAAPDLGTAPIEALPQEAARKLVTEARHTFDAIAARQLWFKLGLPTVPAMHSMPEQLLLPYYPARQGGQS